MEVEINKEILNIREGVFFGLPLRELTAVLTAMILSLIAYLMFGSVIICALVSAVPITIGFVNYHGMHGGKAILVILGDMTAPRQMTASQSETAALYEEAHKYVRIRERNANEHSKKDA